MALFRASTRITLGDGNKALFWQDNWSGKGRLRDIAPHLYKVASRKKRPVAKELQNENWITAVSRLNSVDQLRDFLLVASITADINLDPLQPDSISWIWTTDGSYSAKSAYKAQFIGTFSRFTTTKIWKAYAEPKCTMFSWLVLHGKILTADRLATRGWPHDPTCQLCLHAPETACHLCKDCPFTSMVWSTVHGWSADDCPQALSPGMHTTVNDWWDAMLVGADKKTKRSRSGRLLYVIWNVWKERNKRIFQGVRMTYLEVAHIAHEDIRQRALAFGVATPVVAPND
jgi:hypothetical protein